MTSLTKADHCSIVVDAQTAHTDWCVFEHQVVLNPGDPPAVILVGACALTDVYHLIDGKTNSEWARIFSNGGKLLVRVVATTPDKGEAFRYAGELMRDLTPICNIKGYNLKGQRKAIICLNNGRRYDTQTNAALDLGIHASAISRHLRGQLRTAQGFVFSYAPDDPIDHGAGA